jgi:DNA-binding NarL/FixJ family response regulator
MTVQQLAQEPDTDDIGIDAAFEDVDRLLTPHRRNIVRLLANGHTNQQIAQKMFLSVHSIKTHLAIIQRRLGTRDRAHTVAVVLRLRILSLDDVDVPELTFPRSYETTGKNPDGEDLRPLD